MNTCSNTACCKRTSNPKFCSRSCAAVVNNQVPKRMRTSPKSRYDCQKCGSRLASAQRKFCSNCRVKYEDYSNRTLGSMTQSAQYQKSAIVRTLARAAYEKSGRAALCELCGYDRHYEVCHKAPISSFPDTALIGQVNDLSNLIGLCRNCHWELDHGLVVLP